MHCRLATGDTEILQGILGAKVLVRCVTVLIVGLEAIAVAAKQAMVVLIIMQVTAAEGQQTMLAQLVMKCQRVGYIRVGVKGAKRTLIGTHDPSSHGMDSGACQFRAKKGIVAVDEVRQDINAPTRAKLDLAGQRKIVVDAIQPRKIVIIPKNGPVVHGPEPVSLTRRSTESPIQHRLLD